MIVSFLLRVFTITFGGIETKAADHFSPIFALLTQHRRLRCFILSSYFLNFFSAHRPNNALVFIAKHSANDCLRETRLVASLSTRSSLSGASSAATYHRSRSIKINGIVGDKNETRRLLYDGDEEASLLLLRLVTCLWWWSTEKSWVHHVSEWVGEMAKWLL